MKRFKKKRYIDIKIFILISIILLTSGILIYLSNMTSKLSDISKSFIDTYNNKLIMDFISNDTLSKSNVNDLINIVKNNKDEIISIDYDISSSYKLLKVIIDDLHNIISNTSFKDITSYDYDIKDDLILYLPILLACNNIYFNNLGPKVPVKIKFLSSLISNLKTKVSNYGINNVLVEIYVDISISDYLIIPFKSESIKNDYSILLSSKIVMGTLPNYFGATYEKTSPMLYN